MTQEGKDSTSRRAARRRGGRKLVATFAATALAIAAGGAAAVSKLDAPWAERLRDRFADVVPTREAGRDWLLERYGGKGVNRHKSESIVREDQARLEALFDSLKSKYRQINRLSPSQIMNLIDLLEAYGGSITDGRPEGRGTETRVRFDGREVVALFGPPPEIYRGIVVEAAGSSDPAIIVSHFDPSAYPLFYHDDAQNWINADWALFTSLESGGERNPERPGRLEYEAYGPGGFAHPTWRPDPERRVNDSFCRLEDGRRFRAAQPEIYGEESDRAAAHIEHLTAAGIYPQENCPPPGPDGM